MLYKCFLDIAGSFKKVSKPAATLPGSRDMVSGKRLAWHRHASRVKSVVANFGGISKIFAIYYMKTIVARHQIVAVNVVRRVFAPGHSVSAAMIKSSGTTRDLFNHGVKLVHLWR